MTRCENKWKKKPKDLFPTRARLCHPGRKTSHFSTSFSASLTDGFRPQQVPVSQDVQKAVGPWKHHGLPAWQQWGRAQGRASPRVLGHLQDLGKSCSLPGSHFLMCKVRRGTEGPFGSECAPEPVSLVKAHRTHVHEKETANKPRKSAHKHKSGNKSEKWAACNGRRLSWGATDSSGYF